MKSALLGLLTVLALTPSQAASSVAATMLDPVPAYGIDYLDIRFYEDTFDCLVLGALDELTYYSGYRKFAPPDAITNFTDPSWSVDWASEFYAVAGGDDTDDLTVRVNFDPREAFYHGQRFYWATYHDGVHVGSGDFRYHEGAFVGRVLDFGLDGKPVPEPATWLALVVGLCLWGIRGKSGL